MKYASRLASMIVPALSVVLMEKPWVSFSFKSISNVDLACKGRAHKNETATAGLNTLADRVSR